MKDNIVKYSKVRNGMSKKYKRIYNKNDNTILLDGKTYFVANNEKNYIDLKTLIIDENMANVQVYIDDIKAENIYVNTYDNLGGITIPYDYIIKNDLKIIFSWNNVDKKESIKLNVIFSNKKDFLLNLKNVNQIVFGLCGDGEKIYVEIKDYISSIKYIIDSLGNYEKKYIKYKIYDNVLDGKILDLRKYEKYKVIIDNYLNLERLIINKSIIKNLKKYASIFDNCKFKELLIVDENDMKLFENNTLIKINENTKFKRYYNEDKGNILKISNGDNSKIIYIDNKDNIVFLDKEYLIKKYDCIDAKIITSVSNGYFDFMELIQDKNNTYKVIINDTVFELTDIFKEFLLLNEDLYIPESSINALKDNNWFIVVGIHSLNHNSFIHTYKEYLIYKKRRDLLKKMGLTEDAINYLVKRKIHSIINTETDEGLVEVQDINKFEIEKFNELGESYKVLRKVKKK